VHARSRAARQVFRKPPELVADLDAEFCDGASEGVDKPSADHPAHDSIEMHQNDVPTAALLLSDPGINQRLDIWIHMAIEDKDPFSPGWCLWKLDARQVNKKHLLQLVTGLRPAAFREIACDTKAALAASKKATVSWSVSSRPEIAATC
jgi:hypothetical protein